MTQTRIALGIEYEGTAFHGWQTQPSLPTIQETLEKSLSEIAGHPVSLHCAGRTDAGVHAKGQVAHFDCVVNRSLAAWTLGINAYLPPSIAVRWAQPVSNEFHARFSALSRTYRYFIYNHTMRAALLRHTMLHVPGPLDVERMSTATHYLVGEHDFTAFRAAGCQSRTPHRRISSFRVTRADDHCIVIEVTANAFLHHMVRNLTGSLIAIGHKKQPVDWLKTLLKQRARSLGGPTARAHGLVLSNVAYPDHFGFPGFSTPLHPQLF